MLNVFIALTATWAFPFTFFWATWIVKLIQESDLQSTCSLQNNRRSESFHPQQPVTLKEDEYLLLNWSESRQEILCTTYLFVNYKLTTCSHLHTYQSIIARESFLHSNIDLFEWLRYLLYLWQSCMVLFYLFAKNICNELCWIGHDIASHLLQKTTNCWKFNAILTFLFVTTHKAFWVEHYLGGTYLHSRRFSTSTKFLQNFIDNWSRESGSCVLL